MKKIYTSFLMLTVAFSAAFAQSKIQTPNKQVNTSKYADRAIESAEVRGGGLSCPVTEGFTSGFPVSWTNQAVNANENWTYTATGGNPDGHMDIAYDEALALQDESLITAPIDLSAIPTVGLYFDWFMSYYWGVDPNDNYDLTVSISVDGGTNYTTLWTEADAGTFDSYAWFTKVIDLSAYASQTAAIFKFNYNGTDGAQAKFDNINFCSLPANDLRLDLVYTGDVINDYIYTRMPLSQATEVIAGAISSNFGVAAQTNLSYDWTVTLDGSTVASGTATGAASLATGEVDTVWVSTGYTPTATGEVLVSFEVSADQTENVPGDNTLEESLLVTDYEWGHDYEDEDYFGFGYAGNDPDGSGGFEVGARFFCQVDGDMIYALQFPLSSTTTSVSVTAKVYEDETTNPAVSETVYDIQAGDLSGTGVNFITIVLDDPVTMTTGSVYTATVAIEAGDSGYILGNDVDDNDGGQTVYFVNDDTWYNWVGLTTAMRLNLDETIGIEENEDVSGVYVFPNPATDVLNVGFLSKQNQNIDMNIISLNGSLIQTQQVVGKAGQSNSVRFDTENLAPGVYMIQMIGANSTLTQRVVVQ
jgi:hypothetical protein